MLVDSKIVKTFLPFLGTALIVFGFVKLSIIYNHFDIRIYEYLDFAEILTLFLSDILLNGLVLIFAFFISYLLISNERLQKNSNLHKEIIETKSFWKRFVLVCKLQVQISFWVLFILIFTIINIIWFPNKTLDYLFTNAIIPLLFIFNFFDFEFRRRYKLRNGKDINPSYSNLVFVIFVFGVFTVNSAVREIKTIKRNSKVVKFIYQNEPVKSNSTDLYLGQTRNFIFIKNIEKSEVKIYERDKISFFKVIKKSIK